MNSAREITIRKQPTRNSKKRSSKSTTGNADSKKKPNKRSQKRNKGKQDGSYVSSDEESKHVAKKPTSKQCINSMIAPIIQHQACNPAVNFLGNNNHHTTLQLPLQPNVIDKDRLLGHFKTTRPFAAAHAMPLHTTPGLGPSTPDLMVRALDAKRAYQRELANLESKYKNVSKSHPLDPNDGEHVQHAVTLVYAALLDRDPDPNLQLSTGYDYNYTGGTMVAIRSSSNDGDECNATIFKTIGASLEDVEVLRIGVSTQDDFHCGGDLKVREVQSCTIDMTGPILEIVPNNDGTVMLIRKRNVIIIMREVDASPGVKEWRVVQKMFAMNELFASVCFVTGPAPCGTLTLCTTNYHQHLQLWIVSDDEASCEDNVKLPPATTATAKILTHRIEDNWSVVRSVDGHSLVACLDRKAIRFYTVHRTITSLRSDPDTNTYRLVYRGRNDFSRWTFECELGCALETTPSEGLLLIATCHKLIVGRIEKIDATALDDHIEETIQLKVLLVFAHNLHQRPVFISHEWDAATSDKDVEHHFVLFGSHLPMSYGVASFTRSGPVTTPVYAARHYPYHPPTFHDTYKLAQTRGFCISAYEPLKQRFYACQSGAVLIRGTTPRNDGEEPRLHILLQTSAGDLLQQRVSYNFDRTAENGDRVSTEAEKQTMALVLQHWHEKLVKQAGRIPYRATGFKTMQKFRDIFNCPIAGNDLNQILFLPPKKKRVPRKVSQKVFNSEKDTQTETEDDEGLGYSVRDGTSTCSDNTQRCANRRRHKYGYQTPTPWRQTIEELRQYRDVLAPSMLAVWGVGDSGAPGQSTNLGQIPTQLPPLADVNERVGSWVHDTSSERCKLVDIAEGNVVMDAGNSVFQQGTADAVTDERYSEDLFSQSWTPSQTFTASQLFKQVEQSGRANAKPAKRAYSKGF